MRKKVLIFLIGRKKVPSFLDISERPYGDDDSCSSLLLRLDDVRDVRVGAFDDVPRLSRRRKLALVQPLLTTGKKFAYNNLKTFF